MLSGCASRRYTPSTDAHQRDSIYITQLQRDSIYLRDSIYVLVDGDTVTKYIERIEYRYKMIHDTVYSERVDSVYIREPYPVEKALKWHERGALWIGRMCVIAIILYTIFLYLKKRK